MTTVQLGGRAFTIATDLTMTQRQMLLRVAGAELINRMHPLNDEAEVTYFERITAHIIHACDLAALLSIFVIPAGATWSPRLAAQTQAFIYGLTDLDDQATAASLVMASGAGFLAQSLRAVGSAPHGHA
jgi:hypothetical protein